MPIRVIDHPADLGIEITAKDKKSLFEEAARGLMHLISPALVIESATERSVILEASDLPQLMVRWLNEIVFLFDSERFLTSSADVSFKGPLHLEARIFGEVADPGRHTDLQDLKAVTYHHIAVTESTNGWSATVFVDV